MFLANFLIALREGLEASLVVGILVAYLVKMGRRDQLRPLWTGVAVAALVPLAAGAWMTFGPSTLSFRAQEIVGGSLSLVAALFVTAMILWMGRNAREQRRQLEGQASSALESGSKYGVMWIAVLAVGREGVETALFVWATVRSAAERTNPIEPALGLAAGLACAIVLGWLICRSAIRLNLAVFFKVTGFLLVFVAAGIVSYGIGDLQEASVIPGWGVWMYDLTGTIDANNILVVLLGAMFNFNLQPTHLQVFAWILYLIVVLPLFIQSTRTGRRASERISS